MQDFKEKEGGIIAYMKELHMKLPSEKINIRIPGAKTILENCFKYFLSMQGKEFIWQPEYDHVAEWLEDNRGRGLLLYGDCGRGKSLLAMYVIPAIILKYMGKVMRVYDTREMNECLDAILDRPLISLDDIGTEEIVNVYGNKRWAFTEIIDAAEKYGKLLIISTNLDGPAIIERYGGRIMERIISTTARVEFKGESLRK
ncbi:MAG: hypothetical protein LBQ74_14095 [Prevotella sp.]|jgi:DNA replication protein DnaC|nr:hypothetical protein [Prevotella sp.]